MSSRLAPSTKWSPGQSGLVIQRNPVSKNLEGEEGEEEKEEEKEEE